MPRMGHAHQPSKRKHIVRAHAQNLMPCAFTVCHQPIGCVAVVFKSDSHEESVRPKRILHAFSYPTTIVFPTLALLCYTFVLLLLGREAIYTVAADHVRMISGTI